MDAAAAVPNKPVLGSVTDRPGGSVMSTAVLEIPSNDAAVGKALAMAASPVSKTELGSPSPVARGEGTAEGSIRPLICIDISADNWLASHAKSAEVVCVAVVSAIPSGVAP